MTFLKLGRRYVNTSLITDVFVEDRRPEQPELHAEVYMAAPMGERSVSDAPMDIRTRHFHVSGSEADLLVRFLDERTALL